MDFLKKFKKEGRIILYIPIKYDDFMYFKIVITQLKNNIITTNILITNYQLFTIQYYYKIEPYSKKYILLS